MEKLERILKTILGFIKVSEVFLLKEGPPIKLLNKDRAYKVPAGELRNDFVFFGLGHGLSWFEERSRPFGLSHVRSICVAIWNQIVNTKNTRLSRFYTEGLAPDFILKGPARGEWKSKDYRLQ